ncbi:MAG: phosphatase PAP2 family protein [Mycobacteriales bacterium]
MLERLRRLRLRQGAVPRWWQEIAVIGACFGPYTLIQNDAPVHATAALHRGQALLRLEDGMHIDIERAMNRWVAGVEPLAVLANYYYVALHFLVPAGILLWMYLRRRADYRSPRNALLWTTLVSLLTFWLAPTAPPRLLPGAGFIDTVARFHAIGGYESGATERAADQFASMPSVHIAFALWCGVTMWRLAAHRSIGLAWLAYPVGTTLAVLVTGNHYLLDVVAGVMALGGGWLLTWASRAAGRRLDIWLGAHALTVEVESATAERSHPVRR